MSKKIVLSMEEDHWKGIVEVSETLERFILEVENILSEAIDLDATHFSVNDVQELLGSVLDIRIAFGTLCTALSIGQEPNDVTDPKDLI